MILSQLEFRIYELSGSSEGTTILINGVSVTNGSFLINLTEIPNN